MAVGRLFVLDDMCPFPEALVAKLCRVIVLHFFGRLYVYAWYTALLIAPQSVNARAGAEKLTIKCVLLVG